MGSPSIVELGVAFIATATAGALIGAAGYAAVVGRRELRRISRLLDQLTASAAVSSELDTGVLNDAGVRRSLDALARRQADTWTLATTDMLTGTLNRQSLLSRLAEELERSNRYGRDVSIVLVDLDHFKRLNDSYGHVAGDLVLSQVASTLRTSVRSVDLVGRYGGEEFLVVLPETGVDAAAALAEKLRRVVQSRPIALPGGHVLEVTISAGVTGDRGDLRLESMIRDADAALYTAKALGRNQVYVFREVAEGSPVRRAPIEAAAREIAVDVGRAAMRAARDALAEALDARSGRTGPEHPVAAQTAATMARAIGLPDGEIERIRTAGLLRDLGELAIPEEILSKPDALAQPEWRVVAEHPRIGQVVLEQAGALRDAATIVLHHHEWYDGRGYPYGLAAHEIPVGARIVAIADAYEAMVAGRSYRPAVSHEAAVAELRRGAGAQFDPELVEVFARVFADGVPMALDVERGVGAEADGRPGSLRALPTLRRSRAAPAHRAPRAAAANGERHRSGTFG